MRARNIKPGFFENDELAACTPMARLCFAGLWMLADREGRLLDRPKRIGGDLFRFETVEVNSLLNELAAAGFIQRYVVEGVGVIQVTNFTTHQNPHVRELASKLAANPGGTESCEPRRTLPSSSPKQSGVAHPESFDPAPDESSTRQAQCSHGAWSAGDGSPCGADTSLARLNPESGFRIPESLIPESFSPDPGYLKPDPGQGGDRALPTERARVCRALRQAGVSAVNPSHPDLGALIDAGATECEFAEAAQAAKERGKCSFAYVVGTVKARRIEAAKSAAQYHRGAMPTPPPTARELERQQRMAAMDELTGRTRNNAERTDQFNTIDVDSRFVQ